MLNLSTNACTVLVELPRTATTQFCKFINLQAIRNLKLGCICKADPDLKYSDSRVETYEVRVQCGYIYDVVRMRVCCVRVGKRSVVYNWFKSYVILSIEGHCNYY